MNKSLIITILVGIALAAGAYWYWTNAADTNGALTPPAATPTPTPTPPANVSPAAAAARKDLAGRLGVPESDITVVMETARDWPDACLGLSLTDRVCAQVITPGFEITLHAHGEDFFYRTNADGSVAYLIDPKG
ncbi:hypothetical protein C4552_04275 [Candidatus Parcubacteria bacterium]|nr:MAG: hypothetical protein C4552_04275 [Candidatus Parcubacteria bacterium]